jgi:hypothetical protein
MDNKSCHRSKALIEVAAAQADFVKAAKAQQGGLYSQVITHSLRDEAATKQAILEELDWIEHAATSSDVVMALISGYGIKSPDQHYRLVPYNYDPAHMTFTSIADTELE